MENIRKKPNPKPLPPVTAKRTYAKAMRGFSPTSDINVDLPTGRKVRTVGPKAQELKSHSTEAKSIGVKRISNSSVPNFSIGTEAKGKETETDDCKGSPVVDVSLIKDVKVEAVKNIAMLKEMLGSSRDTVVNSKGVYFWRNKCIFSQWMPLKFTGPDGFVYANTEQWMMAGKARVFKDHDVLNRILQTPNPKAVKALGRKVSNFNDQIWKAHRERIVLEGNLLKFSQNKALATALLATGDKVLVEASPVDKIWGVGMNAQIASQTSQSQWKGLNLLGIALMETRRILRAALLK